MGGLGENLKFRSDRQEAEDESSLAFCLVSGSLSLVSRAVHLRSTNLSIVSRQISGNITDIS